MTSFDPRSADDFAKAIEDAARDATRQLACGVLIFGGVLALCWFVAWNWGL